MTRDTGVPKKHSRETKMMVDGNGHKGSWMWTVKLELTISLSEANL